MDEHQRVRVGTTCSGGKQDTRRGVRHALATSVAGLRDAAHPSHVSLTPPPAHGACPVAPGVSGLPPCTGGSPRPGKRPHLAEDEILAEISAGACPTEISAQLSGPRSLCASCAAMPLNETQIAGLTGGLSTMRGRFKLPSRVIEKLVARSWPLHRRA